MHSIRSDGEQSAAHHAPACDDVTTLAFRRRPTAASAPEETGQGSRH